MPLAPRRQPERARLPSKPEQNSKKHIVMKLILSLTVLLLGASLAAAAEGDKPKKPGEGKGGDGKRPNPEEMFKRLDANADGSVSKDEYLAGPRAKQDPAKAGENFGRIDKDGDGKLSKEEFSAMAKGKDGKGKRPAEGEGGKKPEAK
jgi:hypothetical protein